RIIRDRIALLKKELAAIDKQMATQRSNRGALIRVALVGYTNAGKSTLMTALSKSDVFAENKLFATLDTTVRKVVVGNLPFLLSDTVGFIRKLPTQLIESFKSTLDETRESDFLIHVIDVSHPQFEDQLAVVERTLAEIGSDDKPTLLLFNKIDLLEDADQESELAVNFGNEFESTAEDLISGLKERFEKDGSDVIFLSAKSKNDITTLRALLYERVKDLHIKRYPYNQFLY
ncbi:MAG TPA: GTPase HflX, partial [Flavobacteriales bacterium]|nr:GTPase HflX [Flavobacteriales bacterium]